ncbi:MAG: hypothetical protein RLZZ175_2417 [Bacteroidota bacterium]
MKYKITKYLITTFILLFGVLGIGFANNGDAKSNLNNVEHVFEISKESKILACSTFTLPAGPLGFCYGDSLVIDAGSSVATRIWSSKLNASYNKTTQKITLKAVDMLGAKDTFTVTSTVSGCTTVTAFVEVNLYSKPNATFTTSSPCKNTVMQFNNTSTISPSEALTHKWSFNYDASTVTTLNATKTHTTNATYTATLIETSTKGCKDTATLSYTIKNNPVAIFDPFPKTCNNELVQYHDTSTISPVETLSYKWTFGVDNSTSTLRHPTKIYNSTGTHSIKLVVTTASGCKDSLSQNISVKPLPVANFAGVNLAGCVNVGQTFNNTSTIASGSIITSDWSFGEGTTISKTNAQSLNAVSKTYLNDGTYQITLNVLSVDSCLASVSKSYVINPQPTPSFTTGSLTINSATNFTTTSTISTSDTIASAWKFGELGASSNILNPSYKYVTAGAKTVQLIATSQTGCKDTLDQVLTVAGIPVADFTVTAPDKCSYSTLTFTNQTTIDFGNVSYKWDFGDGTSSNDASPSKKFAQAGTYSITLIATEDQGGADTITKSVKINPVPNSNFLIANACANSNANFTNSTSIASGTFTSAWNFGDGNTSSSTNPTHTYLALGTYNAKLIVTSDSNCVDSTTVAVNVTDVPTASFTVNDTCFGASHVIKNNSTISSGNLTYFWEFGDSTNSTDFEPTITYSTAATFTIKLTASSGNGCAATATQNVQVFQAPIADFAFDARVNTDTIYFTNQSSIGTGTLTYAWKLGQTGTSTDLNPKYVFPKPSAYSVTLTATSDKNCVSSISKTVNYISVGVVSKTPPVVDTAGFYINGTKLYLYSKLDEAYKKGAVTRNYRTTRLYVDGSLYNDTLIDIGGGIKRGEILNLDSIFVAGNISNRIPSKPLFLSEGFGTVTFRYGFLQYVRNDTVNFNSLVMDKFQQKLTLQRGITVNSKLRLKQGTIDFVHYNIDLLDTGTVVNETPFNYLFGDKGWIIARNRLATPGNNKDYSSLGLIVKPTDNLGDVTYYRRNDIQDSVGEGSIRRLYDLHPDNEGDVGLVFKYIDSEWENLPKKQNEPFFRLWYSKQAGEKVDESSKYIQDTLSVSDATLNNVSTDKATVYTSGLRVTVADTDCDTPPKLTLPKVPVWFCDGDSITLDAGDNVTSWKWSNGKSTQKIKLKSSDITGLQDTINVLCYNKAGCRVSQDVIVQVNPKPVVSFNAKTSACLGTTIQYDNTTTITPSQSLTYKWTFSVDGYNSTELNPVKKYETLGNYTIKLVATSSYGCTDSSLASAPTSKVLIQPMPVASFALSNATRCVGAPVTLTNNSTVVSGAAIARSNWTFGDGFTSVKKDSLSETPLDNELKAYSKSGIYTIKLLVTSNAGCKDSTTQSIVVTPNPTASFTFSGLTTGTPTSFTNTSSISTNEPMNYNWTFGENNGASAVKNPVFTYQTSGAHTVKLLTFTNAGCKDSVSQDITTNGDPVAAFTFSAPDFCSYSTVTFANQSTIDAGGLTYSWNFGDGTSSTLQNPTKKYDKAGTYTVALTAISASGGTNVTTKVVVINPVPTAKFTVNPVCVGTASAFTNISTISAGTYTSAWNFGDTKTSTTKNPTNLYSTVGDFTTKLKVTSNLGCVDSVTQIAVVNELPVADFTVTNVCLGAPTSITNNSTISSGNLSYNWNLGNASTSTETNPIFTYANAGNYTINLTVSSSNGCNASTSKVAQVYQNPVVKFSSAVACNADTTYFTNQSTIASGTLTYVWKFTATDSSTVKNGKFVFPNANTYTVALKAISDKNCTASTSNLVEVKPLPSPDFTTNTVCIGEVTNFTNTSTIVAPLDQNQLTYSWVFDNGKTSVLTNPVITYATAKTYNVKLSAQSIYGCVGVITKPVTIHTLPNADFTVADVCSNTPLNITNTSSASEGLPLSYTWNFNDGTTSTDSIPTKTFTNEKINNIDLTATSTFGCSATKSKTMVTNPIPVVNFTAAAKTCVNQTYNLTNASTIKSGSLTYSWDLGNNATPITTNPSTTYANAGTYNIVLNATSDKGCVASKTSSVVVNSLPVPDFTVANDASNNVLFTNKTTITPTETINYNWNFGNGAVSTQTNPTYKYFSNGYYDVTLSATSANGCKASVVRNIKYPNTAISDFADFTTSGNLCRNNEIQFNNTSGFDSDTLTYAWNFGDGTTSTLKNPAKVFGNAGSFNVSLTVTPNTGSPVTKTKTIVINALPTVAFTIADVCVGEKANFVNTSSPSVNVSYAWDLGDGTNSTLLSPNKTYSIPGNYSSKLTVTTPAGCTANTTQNFIVKTAPRVELGDTIRTCGASFTLDAKNAGSTYLWNNASTSQTLVANTDGKYKVTVTGTNACKTTDSVLVLLNTTMLVNLGGDRSVCNNYELNAKNEGSTYLWNTGATTQKLNVTSAGTYSVTVTDQNSCTANASVMVSISTSPTPVNLGADASICDTKPIVLDVTQTGATYEWLSGQTTATLPITASGIYGVKVTLPSGCSSADTVAIQVKNAPKFSLGNDITLCSSELPLTLNAWAKASSYLWNNLASTDSSLTVTNSGNYIVTATGANACTYADTINVTVNTNPTVSLGPDANFCTGNATTLDAQNVGSNYLWSNGATTQTISATNAGKYEVEVTDNKGCKAKSSIRLTEKTITPVSLGADLQVCSADLPKTITAPSGYTSYNWIGKSNTTQQISTNAVTDLILEVKDAFNCVARDTITVSALASPVINLGTDTSFCKGSTFVLNAQNAGANYLWSNGETNQTITVATGGTYGVDVTATNGCKASAERKVTMFLNPRVDLGIDRTLCQGQTWTLNAANSGATYSWSTTETTQEIIAKTTANYKVTITDVNQCKATDEILLTFESAAVPVLGADISACSAIPLDAGVDAKSYLWSTNETTKAITANITGEYVVTTFSTNKCIAKDTVNVNVFGNPVVNLGKDTVICDNQLLKIYAGNVGATYLWSTAATSENISVIKTGNYAVRVTDKNNCTARDTINVIVNPTTDFDLGADKDVCIGNSTTIVGPTLAAGSKALWSNGATTSNINVNQAGVYKLVLTNSFNCKSTDSIKVNTQNYPVVNLGNDTTVCASVVIDAKNSGNTYVWNTNKTTQTETVTQSGLYWVKVTNQYACTKADSINVTVLSIPSVALGQDVKACKGEVVTLNVVTNAPNFQWNTGATTQNITVGLDGKYSVKATNANGCSNSDTVDVAFLLKPTLLLNESYLICANTSQTLDAGNAGSVYDWSSTTGFTSRDKSITVNKAGFYYLKVENSNSCVARDTVEIKVSPNAVYASFLCPSVANIDTVSIQFVNLSYPAPFTSKWRFGDGFTSTETDPLHKYNLAGNLTVTLTVTNGTCSDTKTKTMKLFRKNQQVTPDSLLNKELVLNANVYPNPNTGRFLFETELAVDSDIHLDFYDLEGQVISSKDYLNSKFHHAVFDDSELTSGMYFLRMIVRDQVKVFKVIIQK